MIYVSRKEHFNAAHKLWNDNWSEEKNFEVFGPCANKNWHGHNFDLIVTVKGIPEPETGFVIDLKKLGQIIDDYVLEELDHKNINIDVPFMKGKMASTEILAMEIWNILAPKVKEEAPNACLHSVELFETLKNSVKYFGQ